MDFIYRIYQYVKQHPLQSFVVFLATSAGLYTHYNSNRENSDIESFSLNKYDPNNITSIALYSSNLTHSYIKPLNRPHNFFFFNNEMFTNDAWNFDESKEKKLKKQSGELARKFGTKIGKNFKQFLNENPIFADNYQSEAFNLVVKIGRWLDVISGAVHGLMLGEGNCGEMASLNMLLTHCFNSNIGIELLSVANKKNTHQVIVLNRNPDSILKKPHTWSKNTITVDTWSDNENKVYHGKNLPKIFEKIKWEEWKAERIHIGEELAKLKMPSQFKRLIVEFINQQISHVLQVLKKEYTKAIDIFEKILEKDINCLSPL